MKIGEIERIGEREAPIWKPTEQPAEPTKPDRQDEPISEPDEVAA